VHSPLRWLPKNISPDQKEEIDEAFYRQLQAASQSQALVLMGDFNHPDISWEDHTARQAQSRRSLQSTDNFLRKVVQQPTRKGALLDLVLTNKEGLVEDVKARGRLGCSDHEIVEFRILLGGSRAITGSKPWTSGGLTLASARSYWEESRGPGL